MEKHSINHNTANDGNMLLSAVVSDAKHLLRCKHCIGTRCMEYFMPCIHLGKTKSGKVKVLVFGDRNWARRKRREALLREDGVTFKMTFYSE